MAKKRSKQRSSTSSCSSCQRSLFFWNFVNSGFDNPPKKKIQRSLTKSNIAICIDFFLSVWQNVITFFFFCICYCFIFFLFNRKNLVYMNLWHAIFLLVVVKMLLVIKQKLLSKLQGKHLKRLVGVSLDSIFKNK